MEKKLNSYSVFQVGTTKGTGGDVLILEEAAYVDPGFFYETVAPLLIVGMTTLIGISTLTSDINFYTRLFKLRDAITGSPIFLSMSVELACQHCKDEGKSAECKHLLHLVPRWQSSSRHERLKTIMSDRPDLIQSELSGLAFDALQQCFRANDIEKMFSMIPPTIKWKNTVFIVSQGGMIDKIYSISYFFHGVQVIDPAAGGPQSDFAIVSFVREKGMATVSFQHFMYKIVHCLTKSAHVFCSLLIHFGMISLRKVLRNIDTLAGFGFLIAPFSYCKVQYLNFASSTTRKMKRLRMPTSGKHSVNWQRES